MKTAKEDARRLVESLPDNATWDDVMYEFYVRQKIDAGIQAADEGRVVPRPGPWPDDAEALGYRLRS